MAEIRNRAENFRRYLERHFGIVLPEGVGIFYAKGVRAGSSEIVRCGIKGELGYAACDEGFNPTNSFIQNFGHLATRNVVELDEGRAKEFAVGRGIGKMELGTKSGHVVVRYKEFTVGLGYYDADEKKVKNRIPEKRRRKIINGF
ncbi:hypothetical protein H0O00_01765 [Candidatus Micrarchaeota archaeon]|nr:hypothetical protein [Candidatus Micrarchaeota archaeon]